MKIKNNLEARTSGAAMYPWSLNMLAMTAEEYYADITRLSFSLLREGYRNPELLSMMLGGFKRPATDSMRDGIEYHMAVLEPEQYNSRYLVFDDSEQVNLIGGAKPRATNRYKEYVAMYEAEAQSRGMQVLPIERHQQYQSMLDVLQNNPKIRELLNGTFREVAIEGSLLNEPMRGLIDATDGKVYNIDLKKIHLNKPGAGFNYEAMQKYITDMDYDAQQWWYRELTGVEDCYLLFQMDEYPYTPCLVKLSEHTLKIGEQKMHQMMRHVRHHVDMNGAMRNIPFHLEILV